MIGIYEKINLSKKFYNYLYRNTFEKGKLKIGTSTTIRYKHQLTFTYCVSYFYENSN